MRILVISSEENMTTAIEMAQWIIREKPGSSITITDEFEAQALIDVDGYNHILKNPTKEQIKELLC